MVPANWVRAAGIALLLWAAPAAAQTPEVRRSLAEYLFLDAQLGYRQRLVAYADDAVEGPGGRGELRFYATGRGTLGGPLGAYLGVGLIGRPGAPALGQNGDPLADPYDAFGAAQNLRLFGAHLEYVLRNPNGPALVLRAGRLSSFDQRARLLLFDGLSARWASGVFGVSVYGGRRAVLDRDFADQRDDAAAQWVAGGSIDLRWTRFVAELGHRVEDIHESWLRFSYLPSEQLSAALSGRIVFGGKAALSGDDAANFEVRSTATALVARVDADWRSGAGDTALWVVAEAQTGRDPRTYGRAGRGPSAAEIDAARQAGFSAARLDRLFFGPEQPHLWAEFGFEQWVAAQLAVQGGAWTRQPLGDESRYALRPSVLEAWLGPEFQATRGDRVGLEARLAFEDPGAPGRVFERRGDGERRWSSLRAYAEVPLRLAEGWSLAVRPDAEAFVWSSNGPRADTSGQLGYAGGLLATLRWDAALRIALRYGISSLPELTSEQVALIHDLELWVGGSY